MRCENCRYLQNYGGYEYPEYDCKLIGDHEAFVTEDGCNLRPMEAKKLNRLHDAVDQYRYGCDDDELPKSRKAHDEYKAYFSELLKRR